MAFFDKLGEKGKEALDKGKQAAEVAKCKVQIGSAVSDMKKVFAEMGAKMVTDYPELAAEKFPELMEKIKEYTGKMDELKAKIAELSGDKAEEKTE